MSKVKFSFLFGFISVFLFGFSAFASYDYGYAFPDNIFDYFFSGMGDSSGRISILRNFKSDTCVFDGSYSAVSNTPSVAGSISDCYSGWNSFYSSDGVNWTSPNYNIGGLQYRNDCVVDGVSGGLHNVIRWQSVNGRSENNYWDGSFDFGLLTTPGYGKYSTYVCCTWSGLNTYGNDPEYGDLAFYDCDGNEFAYMSLDVNGISFHHGYSVYDDTFPAIFTGDFYSVVVVNDFDNFTHSVYYVVYSYNSSLVCVSSVDNISGLVNGFGSLRLERGKYNIRWNGVMGLVDFKVYASDYVGAYAFDSAVSLMGSDGDISSLSGWISCMVSGGMKCFSDMLSGVEIFDGVSLLYVIVALIAMNILITFLWSRFKGASLGSSSVNYIAPDKDKPPE